jgi:hypothetical protein
MFCENGDKLQDFKTDIMNLFSIYALTGTVEFFVWYRLQDTKHCHELLVHPLKFVKIYGCAVRSRDTVQLSQCVIKLRIHVV